MVGPERHKMKEGLKGLVTQRDFQKKKKTTTTTKKELPRIFFSPYFQSGTILSMQSHTSRQSEIAVIEAELGVLDTYSFNSLCIFSYVLR